MITKFEAIKDLNVTSQSQDLIFRKYREFYLPFLKCQVKINQLKYTNIIKLLFSFLYFKKVLLELKKIKHNFWSNEQTLSHKSVVLVMLSSFPFQSKS